MMLSELDLDKLETGWQIILDSGTKFGEDHYNRIFVNFPEIRKLFSASTEIQAKRLIYGLNRMIVNYRENSNEVMKYVKLLGRQHRGFKAKKSHYPIIKDSLIKSGNKLLPEEYHVSWSGFIAEISEIMEKNM